jgi:hypothetical protein
MRYFLFFICLIPVALFLNISYAKVQNVQLHYDFGSALYVLCTFSGFADWWREPSAAGDFIFLSEPQFWVNLNKLKDVDDAFGLSIDSEVELSLALK